MYSTVYSTEHFEISLTLLRDSSIVIILLKFNVYSKYTVNSFFVNVYKNKLRIVASIVFTVNLSTVWEYKLKCFCRNVEERSDIGRAITSESGRLKNSVQFFLLLWKKSDTKTRRQVLLLRTPGNHLRANRCSTVFKASANRFIVNTLYYSAPFSFSPPRTAIRKLRLLLFSHSTAKSEEFS